MKRTLIAAGIAAACFSVPAAAAVDTSSLYLSATSTDVDFAEDNAVAVKVGYNRTMKNVGQGLSFDIESTNSVKDAEGFGRTASYSSLAAFLRFSQDLGSSSGLGVYGRFGATYLSGELEDASGTDSENGINPAYGAGLSFDIGNGSSVYADYTMTSADIGRGLDVDISEMSVGVKVAF